VYKILIIINLFKMEKETIVILSETAYKILNITYAYDDTDHEYPFCVSTEIRIPKFDGVLIIFWRKQKNTINQWSDTSKQ
jgi:hypothetical protein